MFVWQFCENARDLLVSSKKSFLSHMCEAIFFCIFIKVLTPLFMRIYACMIFIIKQTGT